MKGEIEKAISEVLRGMGVETPDFVVEHPADLTHGDYATNVAMVLYKKIANQMKLAGVEVSTLEMYYYKDGQPRTLVEFAQLLKRN